MSTPFVYGKLAPIEKFTNRQKEKKSLQQSFDGLTNTILISPRRWGKSSLIKNVGDDFVKKNKQYRIIYLDAFSIYSEQDFYSQFASACIKATSTKVEEWVSNVSHFLGNLKPSISLGGLPDTEFEVGLEMSAIKKNYLEILNLPEKIASEKKLKLIICIDEFQNIHRFTQALAFQKRLRASWQHHQQVCYCLYGSKRHMLMHLFESASMPFYKFGDVLYLQKIDVQYWIPFIIERFASTKKNITADQAIYVVKQMKEHPYYVQQLCSYIWYNTTKKVSTEIIEQSITEMLDKNDLLFQKDFDQFSEMQMSFLKALACGEKKIYANDVIKKYNLNSSSNIVRIIKSLEEKEIINKVGKQIEIADPAFELFITKVFRLQKVE